MFENLRLMLGHLQEDWRMYEHDVARQGLWVMAVYRFGRWRYGIQTRAARVPFSFVYRVLKVLVQILTGVDLPCEVTVGRRFLIEHFGGIVINGDAAFGDDCVVRHNVTVGIKRAGERGVPRFGNRVDIGVGAVILGPICIGDDVIIGANAVVVADIPPNSVAVGIPARVRPRRGFGMRTDCSFDVESVLR